VAHRSHYRFVMMNKLAAVSLVLTAFAFACSTPAAIDKAADLEESEKSEGAAKDDDDDKDEDKPASSASKADASAPATSEDEGKGEEDGEDLPEVPEETPNAACMTACNALDKCQDKSFCEAFCIDEPEVIRCLQGRPSCGKQDIVACIPADDDDDMPADENKGGKGGK